jgi:hypothetical protein
VVNKERMLKNREEITSNKELIAKLAELDKRKFN